MFSFLTWQHAATNSEDLKDEIMNVHERKKNNNNTPSKNRMHTVGHFGPRPCVCVCICAECEHKRVSGSHICAHANEGVGAKITRPIFPPPQWAHYLLMLCIFPPHTHTHTLLHTFLILSLLLGSSPRHPHSVLVSFQQILITITRSMSEVLSPSRWRYDWLPFIFCLDAPYLCEENISPMWEWCFFFFFFLAPSETILLSFRLYDLYLTQRRCRQRQWSFSSWRSFST